MHRAITTAAALLLLLAGTARAATDTARRGDVTATFTHTATSLHLTIARAGAVVYDRPVSSRYCGSACAPGGVRGPSVHAVDLDGSTEVVLDLYTGGAHCCTVEQVFSYVGGPHARYRLAERNFGDPGAVLRDLRHDGRDEFVSADDAFAYAFTDYADSGLPVQILSFSRGRFHDVTRRYPSLIRSDAAKWWRTYRRDTSNGEGVIAAWAADEDLLGSSSLVTRTLARERRAGHITAAFVKQLAKFLRQFGYAR